MALVRKFAVGVVKGKPLDSRGPYTIVEFRGEKVAQFSNGAMAKFIEEEEPTAAEELLSASQPDPQIPAESTSDPSTFFREEKKIQKHKFAKTQLRYTFNVWPALAVTLWADGFSLELTWLNFGVQYDYTTELKRRSE